MELKNVDMKTVDVKALLEKVEVMREYEQLCREYADLINSYIPCLERCGLALYARNRIRVRQIIPHAYSGRCSYTIVSDVGAYREYSYDRLARSPPIRLSAEPEDDAEYVARLAEAIKCARECGARIAARFFKAPIADVRVEAQNVVVRLEDGEEKRYSVKGFASLARRGRLILKI